MPHWGRPSGAIGGSGEMWKDEFEARRRRFLDVGDESDDGYQRVHLDPAAFKSRSADRLPREDFVGDDLLFTGYDLSSAWGERRADDTAYERRPQGPQEDDYYHDNALTRSSRENILVQSAKEKLRRARVKGKTNVSLSVEEMAALERSSTQSRDTSEPSTPNKNKTRGSRSSSTTSLTNTRPRRTSIGLFGGTSPSHSRSRTPKTSRKPSNEQQPVARASGSTPPAFMIRGSDGVPMYASTDYYPSPPRRPSGNSTRNVTPPYEAYSARGYGADVRAPSSSSNRALYDENAWASSSRPSPGVAYPDMLGPSSLSGAQSRQGPIPSSDVSYAKLRRAPQGSPLYNVEPAFARGNREAEVVPGARPASSESSSDDSGGQGVRIEVEPGFGLRRVPVSSKSSGTVRRKGRR
ncbi:hypothetical protein KCU81_g5620, partial [Aureobasidium melanogenum]|uniref:Uncharacterized protein n=1 Tax=Aureobasidium melanogenum (strain CBS 110374) TaxID=1043003 RepID=A0A074VW45_AURM1